MTRSQYFYSLAPVFVVSIKMHQSMGSWFRDFKHYRQKSMGKLYFVGFLFSWFKWTTKSAKIITPQLTMISLYMSLVFDILLNNSGNLNLVEGHPLVDDLCQFLMLLFKSINELHNRTECHLMPFLLIYLFVLMFCFYWNKMC